MPAPHQKVTSLIIGRILCLLFLVSSFAMITVYFNEGESGPLHMAQAQVSGLFAPLKFMGGAIDSGTNAIGDSLENKMASETSIESLQNYNAELINEIAQLEEYRQEAQRTQALLGLKDSYNLETIGARVISRSSNAWDQVVTIDRGSEDGVLIGLPVVGPGGLAGRIVSVGLNTSDIRLLTDPLSGVAVMIQSNRAEGVVYGSHEGLLYLENIDDDVDVEIGDVIITSGLGGNFQRGLTVGLVVKIDETQSGFSRKIVVSPNEGLRSLEEVLVVTGLSDTEVELSEAEDINAEGSTDAE